MGGAGHPGKTTRDVRMTGPIPSANRVTAVTRTEKSCDVLIVGAGTAGACLARQLRLEQPELSIINVDRKESFDWWVGESTIEAFDDYAMRNLQLGPYLMKHHIVKHGLRFWFDSEEKNLDVAEMSEHGRARYPGLNPGVQIDRASFDRDMARMNRELGVEVLLGTPARLVRDDPDTPSSDTPNSARSHRVDTPSGPIRCRHLVDATGRASLLGRAFGVLEKSSQAPLNRGAYWARLSGCRSIDELGDDSFRRRVDYTLRWASTNHFMYDGYWIWLIPVSDEHMSVGVTYDADRIDPKIHEGRELLAFLRSHRALDQILGPAATLCDFQGAKRMVQGARQFFSQDRWYLCGMAGAFVDPLFSSSSALLALGNRLICELIATDRRGDEALLARRRKHFNLMLRNIFLRQLDSFSRYHAFGSFDAFVNWKTLRYHTILNVELPLQRADFKPLLDMFDDHDDDCDCAVGRWTPAQTLDQAGDRLTDEFVAYVENAGTYFARNRGYFHELTELPELRQRSVQGGLGEAAQRQNLRNWEAFVRYFVARMCAFENLRFCEASFRELFQPDWNTGQTLAELMSGMRRAAEQPRRAPADTLQWNVKGPVGQFAGDGGMDWIRRFTGPDGDEVV